MAERDEVVEAVRAPSLVRWGPSFGGAVFAVAATATVMSLWMAIGYESGNSFFVHNLRWFFLGTALGAMFLGGVIAGWVSGIRGSGTGFFTGLTMWGLVLVGVLVPLSLRVLATSSSTTAAGSAGTRTATGISSGNLWALFGALFGGLLCAVIGATMGATPGRLARGRWGTGADARFSTSEARLSRDATYRDSTVAPR